MDGDDWKGLVLVIIIGLAFFLYWFMGSPQFVAN